MNKVLGLFLWTMLWPLLVSGQSQEAANLLRTDSTWKREHFSFPLSFAAQIPLVGHEEACFPPGWADASSPEFWSYVFVWSVNTAVPLTEKELENYLKIYFDGLMDYPQTKVGLRLQKGSSVELTRYAGKVKTTDAFFAKKSMTLHVQIENQYCKQAKKSYICFRFSPKALGRPIWQVLDAAKLLEEVCAGG